MRTTLQLDTALLAHARREAAKRGVSVTALIEEGLRLVLAQSRAAEETRTTAPIATAVEPE